MKFMVTTKIRESYYALPPEKQAEQIAAYAAWQDKHIKSGRCKEAYLFTNMQEGVGIWDLTSGDEAARITMEFPGFNTTEIHATPLVEWDVAIKVAKEAREAAQKATKR